jgi:hypothetical protein
MLAPVPSRPVQSSRIICDGLGPLRRRALLICYFIPFSVAIAIAVDICERE